MIQGDSRGVIDFHDRNNCYKSIATQIIFNANVINMKPNNISAKQIPLLFIWNLRKINTSDKSVNPDMFPT